MWDVYLFPQVNEIRKIPPSPSLCYRNSQTYAGFAFVFYYFSSHYFCHHKVAQRQHRDTAEWSLGIKAYNFLDKGDVWSASLMEIHTSQSLREGFPDIMPGGKDIIKCWTESIWLEGPVRDEAGSVGSTRGSQLQEERKPHTRRAEALRWCQQFGQCSLARIAGEMSWVGAQPPQKLLHLLYNIIACFIDIHSKAVYNTIVRHIFGEIWYVVKKMQ